MSAQPRKVKRKLQTHKKKIMKKLFGIIAIVSLFLAGCVPAVHAQKNLYPRWYQVNNNVAKLPMKGSYQSNPLYWDTVADPTGGKDTSFIRVGTYHNIVKLDSLRDSMVFCVLGTGATLAADSLHLARHSKYGGSFSGLYPDDEIIFIVQNGYDTVGTNTGTYKNHHKIKFRNKYMSPFLFTTAADSTIALSSKQRLYMTFKVIDPYHLLETGKVIK